MHSFPCSWQEPAELLENVLSVSRPVRSLSVGNEPIQNPVDKLCFLIAEDDCLTSIIDGYKVVRS